MKSVAGFCQFRMDFLSFPFDLDFLSVPFSLFFFPEPPFPFDFVDAFSDGALPFFGEDLLFYPDACNFLSGLSDFLALLPLLVSDF